MSIPVLLGIDLGTSSVKVSALAANGSEVTNGTSSYAAGQVHASDSPPSLDGWWNSIRQAIYQALSMNRLAVQAIGLSGQMHGVVLVDSQGAGIYHPIIWNDTRAAPLLPEADRYAKPYADELLNLQAPGFAAAILFWLARARPDLLNRARWALQPKDWLGARLTGAFCTEVSDASATGLWDFSKSAWHEGFCRMLSVDAALLPPVLGCDRVRGALQHSAAHDLGLPPGIPVTMGRADTAAAQLGSSAPPVPGQSILILGTGGQFTQIIGSRPNFVPAGLMGLAGPLAGSYYLMAPIYAAGLSLNWLRALWSLDWGEFYDVAFSTAAATTNPLFTPFGLAASGDRARPATAALGDWHNLRLDHTQAHLIRASLEGCLYALRQGRDLLLSHPQARQPADCALVGGGARDDRVRQLVADIFGIPVKCPDLLNASARGAALTASVAAGWSGTTRDACTALARPVSTYYPDPKAAEIHTTQFRQFKSFTGIR
ncbi:MAG TPA: FGGY family carbohydrate kinase [Streptosporangiaceae bacterium]|nr:FGGY family carbohydrate kinase [Streptosporangiaceae bacterium]